MLVLSGRPSSRGICPGAFHSGGEFCGTMFKGTCISMKGTIPTLV